MSTWSMKSTLNSVAPEREEKQLGRTVRHAHALEAKGLPELVAPGDEAAADA